jgi:hypothetical protein
LRNVKRHGEEFRLWSFLAACMDIGFYRCRYAFLGVVCHGIDCGGWMGGREGMGVSCIHWIGILLCITSSSVYIKYAIVMQLHDYFTHDIDTTVLTALLMLLIARMACS